MDNRDENLIRSEAEKGNIKACISMYQIHKDRNWDEAMKWLKKAAAAGENEVLDLIIALYEVEEERYQVKKATAQDHNREYDAKERLYWLKEGIKHGRLFAYCCMGKELIKGDITEKNIEKGIQYLQYAADRGEPHAIREMALRFCYGKDVPVDLEKALKYAKQCMEDPECREVYKIVNNRNEQEKEVNIKNDSDQQKKWDEKVEEAEEKKNKRRTSKALTMFFALMLIIAVGLLTVVMKLSDKSKSSGADMAEISISADNNKEAAEGADSDSSEEDFVDDTEGEEYNGNEADDEIISENVQQIDAKIFEKEEVQRMFENLAYAGWEFRNLDELQEVLGYYVFTEFEAFRWGEYNLDERGYLIVPEEDVLSYIYETFGIHLDYIELDPDNVLGTVYEDGYYYIGGASGGDIREFVFEGVKKRKDGYIIEVNAYMPEINDEGEFLDYLDATYHIKVKAADNVNGFIVTELTVS